MSPVAMFPSKTKTKSNRQGTTEPTLDLTRTTEPSQQRNNGTKPEQQNQSLLYQRQGARHW